MLEFHQDWADLQRASASAAALSASNDTTPKLSRVTPMPAGGTP